jgi:hypothetical protein
LFTLSMNGILQEMWQPCLILGGGTVISGILERKDKQGAAMIVKIAALVLFVFIWLFPMLNRLSWLFRGAMSLPLLG